MTTPKSIAAALASAQAEMGKALKTANNPHFRSKYADLASVMDACLPALNKHGIAVIQPTIQDDGAHYVETIFIFAHGDDRLSCRVPIIVGKNDMQGFGSAVTYARRYGLMAMAGIAPEDDDGNAAAKNPPKEPTAAEKRDKIMHAIEKSDDAAKLEAYWKDPRMEAGLKTLPEPMQRELMTAYAARHADLYTSTSDMLDDNIPGEEQ